MYHQPDDIKVLSSAAMLDPKSVRGRQKEDDTARIEKQALKRNEKKKRQKQKKKERQLLAINKEGGSSTSTAP